MKFREFVNGKFHYWGFVEEGIFKGPVTPSLTRGKHSQFTGFKDKNGKDIYDGDIFRLEEQTKEICDQCDGCGWYEGGKTLKTTCEKCNGEGEIFDDLDRIHWLIITYVKEWGLFGTLHKSEYHDYLEHGIEALDEPMFWTYTLEDTDDKKYFLCGNIYENPELL